MRQIETRNWRRISKAKARQAFIQEKDILFIPHKCIPENWFGIGSILNIYGYELDGCYDNFPKETWFDKIVDVYTFYGCQCSEWGKYPAFYERRNG